MKPFLNIIALLFILFVFTCSTTGEYIMLPDANNLQDYVDRQVCLEGEISQVIWQHMIAVVDGYPYSEYFDVKDYQIVIYTKNKISCGTMVRVYGRVIKVEGQGKRYEPGDELYREYHLAVDRWECVQ